MKHIDQGTIQAFLDGELMGSALERASSHLAACEMCAAALVEAEAETMALAQAFAAENSFAVPTQRIWARIENEIEALDTVQAAPEHFAQPSLWQRLSEAFGAAFLTRLATPALGATALALVVTFALFSVNFNNNQSTHQPEIAGTNVQQQIENQPPTIVTNSNSGDVETLAPARTGLPITESRPARNQSAYQFVKASAAAPRPLRKTIRNLAVNDVRPKTDLNAPLTEERAYLDAIDDLSKSVAASDEVVMRPSFQVEYEQNMAVMDRAIAKMQRQVRRNPTDENAKRILFASYQNKIDLLNTVAEKSQLMATLR